MSPIEIGIIGVIAVFVLLFMGMPIALALILVGVIGTWQIASLGAALPVVARTLYQTASHYPYMVIPMFIIMGGFAASTGMVGKLYGTFEIWLRKLPGGLGAATIAACAAFSAVSGSSVATSAAMGTIAYPEMEKFDYSPKLSTGAIAAGGTLGFLIPPSIGFVVYGMLTEQSIGELLIAGVIPGILLTAVFIAIIVFMVKRNPSLAPPVEKDATLKEKIISIKGVWEILLIFLVVMGGIYLGWFSPNEAGAVGATALLLVALVKRKLTLNNLFSALRETVRVSTMVLFLVAGASVFTYFLAISTIPTELAQYVAGLDVSRYMILVIILLVYFFLGMFIDAISMMVLTMPVVFPMIIELGFDPIFFGVICVLMMQVGLITPPMGLNLYTIAGTTKVDLNQIFLGALPFIFPVFIVVALIIIFPGIATFLPSLM